ncbi:MAG: hypothetical protein RMJ87_00805 [Cytophagales bacterium]|nr:hypothetical protein [Bernardetiaceae bacterium]MDW8203539.1 hypothetical protein [Cytophagales bacterium]
MNGKEKHQKAVKYIIIVFFVIGVITRANQFFYNKSLWVDEAMLALNVVERDYKQLLQTLDYNQMAPVGFLLISKFVGSLTKYADWGLRLVPFLTALASLYLFWLLLRYLLPENANRLVQLISVILFACSFRLMYFASEFKQYSSDVFWALLVLLVSLRADLLQKPKRLITALLVGAIGLWFSHPLIFVLAGIGIYWVVENFYQNTLTNWFKTILLGIGWLSSFLIEYLFILSKDGNVGYMQQYWKGNFLPLFPTNRYDFEIWLYIPEELFYYTIGVSHMSWLLMFIAITGVITFWHQQARWVIALVLPFLIVIASSMLQLYPYNSRLLLFLTPLVAIIVGKGTSELLYKLQKPLGLAVLLSFLVLSQPIALGVLYIFRPMEREEVKPILQHYQAYAKHSDVLYVYYGAVPAVKYYYMTQFSNLPGKIVFGNSARQKIVQNFSTELEQIKTIKPQRIWLLFSHVFEKEDVQSLELVRAFWKEKQKISTTGASLYLFEHK